MSSNDTILETPPSTVDESELASALDVAPPSRRSVAVTRVLVALLLVALGATAGMWWANRTSSTTGGRDVAVSGGLPSGGTLPSGFPSGAPGGSGQGTTAQGTTGQGGTGSAAAGTGAAVTTGTVKLVDGDTVYVATSDGKVVKVKVATTTTVSRAASIADVKAGSTVVVAGTTGSDGTVTATSVTERPTS